MYQWTASDMFPPPQSYTLSYISTYCYIKWVKKGNKMFSSKLHTKAYIRKKKALNLYNYFNDMILVNYSYCVMKE